MTTMQASSRRVAIVMAAPLPSLREELVSAIREWRHRARSRRDLMALGERDLRDVRLTRADAEREARKPLWRE